MRWRRKITNVAQNIMKLTLLLTCLTVVYACNNSISKNQNDYLLNDIFIGMPVENISDKITNTNQLTISNTTSLLDLYELERDSIIFKIGVRDCTIEYIATSDKKFLSSEQITIGMPYDEVLNKSPFHIYTRDGFGVIIPLKSNWNAVFSAKTYQNVAQGLDSATVIQFFKNASLKRIKR